MSAMAVATFAGLVYLALSPNTAWSQAPGGAGRTVPRSADGKPDLSGFWQTLTTANWNIQAHAASSAGPAGFGVVDADELPYQPWAAEKRRQNYVDRANADPESKCFLPGVPRIMYMPYPFQIAQTPKAIVMLFEYRHAMRNIYLDSEHYDSLEWWMGDSRGRWEGDTLVVHAKNFNDATWFDRAGNFHSEALQVVERYTLTDPDHISYEATINDPKVFTRPWKINVILYRRKEPNFRILEHACETFLDEAAGNLTPDDPDKR